MKHWHWVSLALLAVVLTIVLMAVPRLGGHTGQTAYAHLITATPSGANAVHFEIDMVKDGSAWCNPVDTQAPHNAGDSYQVAVCLTSSSASPASFNFDLVYDDSINLCAPDTDCTVGTCTDDNPDANADDSLATYTTWTVPDLGDGYDCGKGGSQPQCDIDTQSGPGHGRAYISCFTTGVPTLPVSATVSRPLAVVSFTAAYEGVDILKLENVAAYDEAGAEIASCYEGDEPYPCFDGTDTKSGEPPPATNTPTVTPTPTPTNTPCPGGECPTSTPTPKAWTKTPTPPATGTPTPAEPSGGEQPAPPPPPPTGGQLPQVVPPGTGSGPADGVPWLNTLIWLVAGVGAVSVALGGLHVRYARHR